MTADSLSPVPVSRDGAVVGVFVPLGHEDAERLLGGADSHRSERSLSAEELWSGVSPAGGDEQFDWLGAADEEAMAEIDRITAGVTGTDLPDDDEDGSPRTFRATPAGQRMFDALAPAAQQEVADALLDEIPRMPHAVARRQTIRSPELAGPVSYARTRSGHVVLYAYEPHERVPALVAVLARDGFPDEVAQWAETHGEASDALTSTLLALVASGTVGTDVADSDDSGTPAAAEVEMPCTCGKAGRRGPYHVHECPAFLAWSWRSYEKHLSPEIRAFRARRFDDIAEEEMVAPSLVWRIVQSYERVFQPAEPPARADQDGSEHEQ